MCRSLSFRYTTFLITAVIAGLTACAGRTALREPRPIVSSELAKGIPVVMVDSLASRIAATEIERARVLARYTSDAQPVQLVQARYAALHEQLREISVGSRAPRRVAQYVLARLDERQAAIAIDHRQLLVTLDADAPRVRQSAEEGRLLEARRAELRASLDAAASSRH